MPQPNGESGMRIYGGAPHLDQVVGLDDWIVVDDDDDDVAHLLVATNRMAGLYID